MSHRHGSSPVPEEIVVYEYAPLVFFWPTIIAGVLFWLLDLIVDWPGILGVAWWICLIAPCSTIAFNIPRNVFWSLLGVFILVVIIIVLLSMLHVSFAWVADLLQRTHPRFDPGTALWTSAVMGTFYCIMLVYARFDWRWVINPNRVQHVKWGEEETALPMNQYKAYAQYDDWMELMLLGAGDIVIYSQTQHGREIARIRNIPFLWFRWEVIRELLEEVRIRESHNVIPTEE